MHIKLDNLDLEKLQKLIETKNININIADMLFSSFFEEKIVDNKKYKVLIKNKKSEDIYFSSLMDYFSLDMDDEENIALTSEYIYPHLCLLKENEYLSNPYVKLIKNTIINKNYSLKYLSYKPFQLLPIDEIKVNEDEYYQEYSQVGYFEKGFNYLALLDKNDIWMSVNPNEINTMKPYIEKSNGDVLVLGLGMGYISFIMSEKENVKSITIIEKEKKIIDIFKENILVKFPHKEKIKIIENDAIEYLADNEIKYDYIFADLWHDPNDGLPIYIKLHNLEYQKSIKIHYWLETSIIAMLRRYLITLMEENLLGYNDKNYMKSQNDEDKMINYLYNLTKKLSFTSYEQIHDYLSFENLREFNFN